MDEFSNYLIVFQSMFVSFVAVEFLVGWRRLIKNRKRYKICWLQLSWTILLFVLLVETWWGSWLRRNSIDNNFGCFALTLTSPAICYFVTAFLFPDGETNESHIDLGQHFNEVRVEFHLCLAALIFTYMINAVLLTDQALFGYENGLRALTIASLMLPAFGSKKWQQWFVFLWMAVIVLYFTVAFRWTMPET